MLLLLLACASDPPGRAKPPVHQDTAATAGDSSDSDSNHDSPDCAEPGTEERCDGVDNDCDGVVDEEVTTTFYADLDGDGFGDPATVTLACAPDEDQVDVGTDCDDTDAGANPEVPEIPGNEADEDCDGRVAPAVRELLLAGEEAGDGVSLVASGDFDADGTPDLAVGALARGGVGVVYVIHSPLAETATLATSDGTVTGTYENGLFGYGLAGAGDVDGDGFDDLLVGAPLDGRAGFEKGAVFLLAGPLDGTLTDLDAVARLEGEGRSDKSGDVLAGGDIDGDGLADLAVGATGNDRGGVDAGTAYVFYGPVSGTASLGSAAAILSGEAAFDYAGGALELRGDLDGDGLRDVITGAYRSSAGAVEGGAVYVVQGPVTGELSLSDAHARLVGTGPGGYLGAALAAGDIDGDGYDDLLAGGPRTGPGVVEVFLGPVSGNIEDVEAEERIAGVEDGGWFGYAVDLRAGRFLVGAPLEAGQAGKVYQFDRFAAGNWTADIAIASFGGAASGETAGERILLPGDLDADGYDDAAFVGSGYEGYRGAVHVLLGL